MTTLLVASMHLFPVPTSLDTNTPGTYWQVNTDMCV